MIACRASPYAVTRGRLGRRVRSDAEADGAPDNIKSKFFLNAGERGGGFNKPFAMISMMEKMFAFTKLVNRESK